MKTRSILTAMATLLLGHAAVQAAATPDPGDYTALPAGTDLFLVYAQQVKADKIYADGQQVVGNAGLTLDVGLLRYVHFMKWGDYTIDPQVILPFGRQTLDLTGDKASGAGDVIFGGTLWTIADLPGGEHLGWSVFLTAPTGANRSGGYALTDNRWAADLQVGYIRRLSPSWSLDLVGQTEFYQDRRDTGARKNALVRGIAHLRYHLSDASHLAVSYRHALGARETLGGTEIAGRRNDGNATLTWASFLSKSVQVQAQWSQDLKVENGPKTRTLGLRTLFVF